MNHSRNRSIRAIEVLLQYGKVGYSKIHNGSWGSSMKVVSQEVQELSIKSLASTYHKLSKSYQSMTEKGSNTTVVKKRRDAIKVGLENLKDTWNDVDSIYDNEVILKSKDVLQSLIPSIKNQLAKAKDGSPQKTLIERRLTALELAIESLDNRLK